MKCNKFQESIPDFVANRLNITESDALRQHLQSCDACAKEVEIERRLRATFLLDTPKEAPDLYTRLSGKLVARTQPFFLRHAWRYGAGLTAAAACALLLMNAPLQNTPNITREPLTTSQTPEVVVNTPPPYQPLSVPEPEALFPHTRTESQFGIQVASSDKDAER